MMEIYSQGDLYRDAQRGIRVVEQRRLLLQGSLWLAMAFDAAAVATVSFENECRDTILSLAPPTSHVAGWTAAVLYMLRLHVFPSWRPLTCPDDSALPKGRAGNNERDKLMVKIASENALGLVTRDQQRKRGQPSPHALAEAAGVSAWTPEAYAARVLSREAARDLFLARLEQHADTIGRSVPPHLVEVVTARMLEQHRAIWKI